MEGDLGERRGAIKSGVPGAPGGGVEAAAGGAGVGERRVDDVGIADAVDELVDADAGEHALFAEEAVVGGVVELHQPAEGVG